jgi:hypothetical protein
MRLAGQFVCFLIGALFTGCAGYRLGPTAGFPAGSRSIQVVLFQNQTLEPRFAESVATSLRRMLQQDGTYRLATHGDGDIVVSGTITQYHRSPLSNRPRDVRTPQDFSISLTAHVTARERAMDRVLWERDVTGRTTVRAVSDFTSVQRQALPLIAEDLARNITSLLVDGDWSAPNPR